MRDLLELRALYRAATAPDAKLPDRTAWTTVMERGADRALWAYIDLLEAELSARRVPLPTPIREPASPTRPRSRWQEWFARLVGAKPAIQVR